MKIIIDEEEYIVEEIIEGSYLPLLLCEDGTGWCVAYDSIAAATSVEEFLFDLVENDPQEFRCLVGDECLINWALGKFDGPGTEHACSLRDWIQICGKYPEEQWASYDGERRKIDEIDDELLEELDWSDCPPRYALAFRYN